MAHLAKAAELLEADEVEGPSWQTGLAAIERFRLKRPDRALPFPASGPANPISPDVELHVTDDQQVHGTITSTRSTTARPSTTATAESSPSSTTT